MVQELLETFDKFDLNPKGWEQTTIGESLKLKSGNFLSAANMDVKGKYPVYGGNGINGYHSAYMFKERKIVLGRVGAYCGAVHYTLPYSWITDNALYVAKKDTRLLEAYLELALRQAHLNQYASQSGQPLISESKLQDVKILIPPPQEQERIVAIAQKADRLRRTRRYALQLSDTYLRSVFLEMFGDYLHSGEVCELDDVITASPSNGLYKSEEFLGSGVLFLDIKCLYRGFSVDFSEPRRVQITEKEQKKYEVFSGDILINRVSKKPEGVGKAVLVIDVKEPTVYESNMMRFRVNPSKVQPWFLIYYLASEVSRRELLSKANISNQASINQETLKSLKLPLPPPALQEKFAEIVQKFDRLRTQQREADRQAEHLFQTLLHRAFRGELTSQNADDEPESVLLEEICAQQAKAEAKAKTATQAMGEAADYLGTKAKQQDIEPIQLKFPGFE